MDVQYKHIDDIREFLIPYAESLKEISLKDVVDSNSFKDAEFQTRGVIDNRIQNLAITIDKVIYVMSINNDDKPPLVKLNIKEIITNLWTHPNSIRWSLINNIKILMENSYPDKPGYNFEELSLVLEILEKNHFIINEYQELFFTNKSENIYSLIKMIQGFIKENIRDDIKENYYHENKQALDKELFEYLEKENASNNKYNFSFKNFNIKSNKPVEKINEKDLLDKTKAYWVNTKYLVEKEKKMKANNKKDNLTSSTEIKQYTIKAEKIFKIGKSDKNKIIRKSSYESQNKKNTFDDIKNNESKINFENKGKTLYVKKRCQKILIDKKFLEDLDNMDLKEANILLQNIKEVFKFISLIMKICHFKEINQNDDKNTKLIYYEGLSDMLYLHSCTQIYFKHNEAYGKQVESKEKISIRDRDVKVYEDDVNNEYLDENIHTGSKIYDKMYIWGQLVGWFKQTVIFLN